MKTLAVIPARMGSARMPRKNLCELEPGLNLVQQAVDCARYSGVVDRIAVTSDENIMCSGPVWYVERPPHLSGPHADISDAVEHATRDVEQTDGRHFDYVVTLQPAVVARSPLIVRRLIDAVMTGHLNGGLTMAYTHRWIWQTQGRMAFNDWWPGAYPRSQDSARRLVEINAVQVASRDMVLRRERWGTPLAIMELPAWAAALDIDTPEDLAAARDLWPWAKSRLETWTGPVLTVDEVRTCA